MTSPLVPAPRRDRNCPFANRRSPAPLLLQSRSELASDSRLGAMSFAAGADAYDRFMGRYSVELAPLFADFAGVEGVERVLDVGCGPGALTAELAGASAPSAVTAIDPTEAFVAAVRERNPGVDVRQASAEDLPFPGGEFDAALAQLVVHFMADPVAGLAEMGRVTREDGVVAACVWDHARRPRPTQPVLGGGARARSRQPQRVRPRGHRRRRPGQSSSRRQGSTGSRTASSPSTSSTRRSRTGGSRTRSGSGLSACTSRASTRSAGTSSASAAAPCCPRRRSRSRYARGPRRRGPDGHCEPS